MPEGRQRSVYKGVPTKTLNVTVSLYPRDDEMVQELKGYFGTSASDVYRTAIRNLYAQLLGKKNA